jgi:glycerol-3-phosphate acyltransferase PlsY
MIAAIIWMLAAYISGSIPSAYIFTKLAKGLDIREHGSGNMGATNVFRVAGPWAAIATLLADALKGYVPTIICMKLYPDRPFLWLMTAMCAVIGHIWTMFLKFKGGKGVATGAGIFLALLPVPTLYTIGVFALVFAVSRYISLSSIISSISLPLIAWIRTEPRELCVFASAVGFLIILKHGPNIKRLLNGTENKLTGAKTNE